MIFRELNKKLYKVPLPTNVTDKQFLDKQVTGSVKFIQASKLPTNPFKTDAYYMLDNNNNVVLDTNKILLNVQTSKIQELKIMYNNSNQLDIPYMATTFQADKASQDLIVSVLSAGSVPNGFFWLDKANNQVAMTYAQLQGLSGAILTRNQANFVKFQGLKAKVKLAKTQADLDLIVW